MKRIAVFALITVMLLSLCACGAEKQANDGPLKAKEGTLLVGFGRVDLTPKGNMELMGYTETRMMTGVMDPIYATCVAITDSKGSTVLIYTLDTLEADESATGMLRSKVAQKLGIPKDNMVVSATHTHSAPHSVGIPGYVDLLVQAAETAMKDRAAATIQAGDTQIEGMNFVRHYNTDQGKVIGDNFGTVEEDGARISHTTQADGQMQLIRFVREGDKKDVLMVNWQAHPKLASTSETPEGRGNRSLLSADFVGHCRLQVEGNSDCLFAYYSGASGNLNPRSMIPQENMPNGNQVTVFGKTLGDHVLNALEGLQSVEAGTVQLQRKHQEINLAGSSTKQTKDITAITIGKIGFAAVPFEMFDTTGMQIKEDSPCDITFVLTCCGSGGYIPAAYTWDYNSGDARLMPYEAKRCRYDIGSAEVIADSLLQMLNSLEQ